MTGDSPAFLEDQGLANSLRVISRWFSRPTYLRHLAWLMPRIARAVPLLGYVTVAGTKPSTTALASVVADA